MSPSRLGRGRSCRDRDNRRRHRRCGRVTRYWPFRRTRSSSATDQAWNGQPVAACGAIAVGGLADRAEAPLRQMGLKPVEQRRRSAPGPAARRRRTGRSARARPCPGGRRGRARPGRPGARPRYPGQSGARLRRPERGEQGPPATARSVAGSGRAAARTAGPGEQLVGPQRVVVVGHPRTRRRRVHHVVQPAGRGDGKRSPERRGGRAAQPRPGRRASAPSQLAQAGERGQPVDPQRVELDGLAGPRGHRHAVRPGRPSRSARAGGALGEQPVGRVDPDAVPGARPGARRPRVAAAGSSSAARSASPVAVTCRLDRVQEPQRARRRCCTRSGRCRRCWRASPRTASPAYAAQQLPALVGPAGGEEQPLVGGHRVPRPGPEPRVAGDHVRPPRAGAHDERVGGQRQRGVDVVGRPPAPPARRLRAGPPSTISPAGGGAASRSPAQALHRQRVAGPSSAPANRPRAAGPRRRCRPRAASSRWCTPSVPLPARASKPGPASRYAPSTTAPSGRRLDPQVGPSARRSPCTSRQVHSGSTGRAGPGRRRRSGARPPTQGGRARMASSPLEHHVADPPPPAGQPVDQVEALQQLVAARVDVRRRPTRAWPSRTRRRRTAG